MELEAPTLQEQPFQEPVIQQPDYESNHGDEEVRGEGLEEAEQPPADEDPGHTQEES